MEGSTMIREKPQWLRYFSYIGHIAVVALVVFSIIWVFIDTDQFGSAVPMKYYTVLSNIFCGTCFAVSIPFSYLLLSKNSPKYQKIIALFDLMGVVGVTMTMLTVILFLTGKYGFAMMYNSFNLFLHLINPIVALVVFLLGATGEYLDFVKPLYAVPPSFLYGVFYFAFYFGGISDDFYKFLEGSTSPALTILVICLFFLFITYAVWFLNALATRLLYNKPFNLKFMKIFESEDKKKNN